MANTRKKKVLDNGFFNLKEVIASLVEINQDSSIDTEAIKVILQEALLKGYKEWWCYTNDFDKSNAKDLLAEVDIDWENGQIHFYDVKKVLNEDDIQDDFIEISLEDAREIDPNINVGDLLKIENKEPILSNLYFVQRVKNDITQKLRTKAKENLKNSYQAKIHHNIIGTIKNTDSHSGVEIDFGRTTGFLPKRELGYDTTIAEGQPYKVYLVDVGEREGKASLIISRTHENFVKALFEDEVPEVSDGTVEIVKVVRQAGFRSKVFVRSNLKNVDPVGALVGNNSVRYRPIINELGRESIDICLWNDDKDLLLLEALKPAQIVGIHFPENEDEPIIAICKNDNKVVAIGKNGCNVRLAGKAVGHEIRILQVDEAISQKLPYETVEDIIARKQVVQKEVVEEKPDEIEDMNEEEVNAMVEEEMGLNHEDNKEVEKEEKPVSNAEQEQEIKEDVTIESKPVAEEVKKDEQETIEIKGRAKVSLSDLEQQIEKERQSQNTSKSYSKKKNKDEDEEKKKLEKEKLEEAQKNAMPIYTQEELEAMDEEEEEDNITDDIDYDDFDDDSFYDDK